MATKPFIFSFIFIHAIVGIVLCDQLHEYMTHVRAITTVENSIKKGTHAFISLSNILQNKPEHEKSIIELLERYPDIMELAKKTKTSESIKGDMKKASTKLWSNASPAVKQLLGRDFVESIEQYLQGVRAITRKDRSLIDVCNSFKAAVDFLLNYIRWYSFKSNIVDLLKYYPRITEAVLHSPHIGELRGIMEEAYRKLCTIPCLSFEIGFAPKSFEENMIVASNFHYESKLGNACESYIKSVELLGLGPEFENPADQLFIWSSNIIQFIDSLIEVDFKKQLCLDLMKKIKAANEILSYIPRKFSSQLDMVKSINNNPKDDQYPRICKCFEAVVDGIHGQNIKIIYNLLLDGEKILQHSGSRKYPGIRDRILTIIPYIKGSAKDTDDKQQQSLFDKAFINLKADDDSPYLNLRTIATYGLYMLICNETVHPNKISPFHRRVEHFGVANLKQYIEIATLLRFYPIVDGQ